MSPTGATTPSGGDIFARLEHVEIRAVDVGPVHDLARDEAVKRHSAGGADVQNCYDALTRGEYSDVVENGLELRDTGIDGLPDLAHCSETSTLMHYGGGDHEFPTAFFAAPERCLEADGWRLLQNADQIGGSTNIGRYQCNGSR